MKLISRQLKSSAVDAQVPLAFQQTRLSATDLSNHLACRHLTTLELQVARGEAHKPEWAAPDLQVIRELGLRHEKRYLTFLEEQKKFSVVNLSQFANKDEKALLAETLRLMASGVDVIAQGALGDEQWFGRPDVLLRVAKPSGLWAWSYEVQDTKLAKETKATSILQLSLYSDLLKTIQGSQPELMWVIPPQKEFLGESYRVAEYAAYYRHVRKQLSSVVLEGATGATYPEPVPHCDVCQWFRECEKRRRGDDHLSLVAGIRKLQRNQLEEWDTGTMAKLAVLPIPLKERPNHGSREGIERAREQARVQVEGRAAKKLKYELLLPVAEGMGLCRLPEPSPGDIFLDLEGDPFAGESGLQYLFGFAYLDAKGQLHYEKHWALQQEEEKRAFEWLIDEIVRRRKSNPQAHVYHFGAYEPSVLKRLMGIYATRQDEIDEMLWEGTFVDLHQILKQSARASVEEYSLKKIEGLYGFERTTPLDLAGLAMRFVQHQLELGWGDDELPGDVRDAIEGYNSEDCFSTAKLRDWLESRRHELVACGSTVARLPKRERPLQEDLTEWQQRIEALAAELTADVPANIAERTPEQKSRWLLARLLDWHRRENKAAHWEGFRLKELDDTELLDERAGLSGLKFMKRVLFERKIPVDRYAYEKQETDAREKSELYCKGEKFGSVVAIDPVERIIDIKKTGKTADSHPAAVYVWEWPYRTKEQAESLYRLGHWVAKNGIDAIGEYRAGRDLLMRRPPRLSKNETLAQLASETPVNTASRIALSLKDSIFAIQGPPGSGKTHTGARMICELVKQGRKIGVTALSHKVIRNLLDAVVEAAREMKVPAVRCMHRDDHGEESDGVAVARKNEEALDALCTGKATVVGGTSFLWSPEISFQAVDVLFIDEAGQMSLPDVLAVSQAAKNLVLLGDPQQLERPVKGSHPDGAEKSALEHLLDGRKTIAEEMGFLLPQSWRLHPEICKFTSEVFYEDKLASHPIARSRVLEGHPWLNGAGLWFVPVEHDGNGNSSAEEVEVVARIVEGLLKPGINWFYSAGNSRPLKPDEILIVAPYNAQVADLSARLPRMRIGTVDKFQGQQAPVVIYSLTTSSPEEAPRGMEFLYSLNRLNVATSRAQSVMIVVGNPRLFEPECRTPRQMQLANALCRFRELATLVQRDQL
ncbi:MAG: TM0106 family RecB-like putative nuclease [Candidatus Acidiferrales bacterium]